MTFPFRTLFNRQHRRAEVDALTDRDLSDLGLSRDQLRHFAQMPADVPERVVAMGAVFGLSEGALRRHHGTWSELLDVCSTCPDRGACALVLAKAQLANPRDAAFCPNRHNFSGFWSAA
ncbi:DUF1127 domain-containing protein [Pseudotabrizicola alkalilacus]|nr:DUF1127 domain-containing protein [Pseudotabrizicola alkalilacus]